MKEIFKDIEGYENLYQISDQGKVKALGNDKTRKERIKPAKDEDKTNNTIKNLEWCTRLYNNNHGTRNKQIAESRSKQVLCVETGKIYASIMEVHRQLGLSRGNISSACNGKLKQAYGYHWRFVS